jgi:hypothetical protein
LRADECGFSIYAATAADNELVHEILANIIKMAQNEQFEDVQIYSEHIRSLLISKPLLDSSN